MTDTLIFFAITIPLLIALWRISLLQFKHGPLKFLYILFLLWVGSYYFAIVMLGKPTFLIFEDLRVDYSDNYIVIISSIITMLFIVKFIPKKD